MYTCFYLKQREKGEDRLGGGGGEGEGTSTTIIYIL